MASFLKTALRSPTSFSKSAFDTMSIEVPHKELCEDNQHIDPKNQHRLSIKTAKDIHSGEGKMSTRESGLESGPREWKPIPASSLNLDAAWWTILMKISPLGRSI